MSVEWVPGFDWSNLPTSSKLEVVIKLPVFGAAELDSIPLVVWETHNLKLIDKSTESNINGPDDFRRHVVLGSEKFSYYRSRKMIVASRKHITFNKTRMHFSIVALYKCSLANVGNITCDTLVFHDCGISHWQAFLKNTARTLRILDSYDTLADLAKLGVPFPRLESNCDGDIGGNYRELAKWFPRYKGEPGAAGWMLDGEAELDWLLAKTSRFIYRELWQRKVTTFLCLKSTLKHDVARLIAEMHSPNDVSLDGLDKFLDDESCKVPSGITRNEYEVRKRLGKVEKELQYATGEVHKVVLRLDAARKRERELLDEYDALNKKLHYC